MQRKSFPLVFRPLSVGPRWSRRGFLSRIALGATWMAGAATAGCGGGGGASSGGGDSIATNAFRVRIDWGPRSRANGLTSALSARITLEKNAENDRDIVFVVNRPETPSGQAASLAYDAPGRATVGNHNLKVEFHADANATGGVVGVAATVAQVAATGVPELAFTLYSGVAHVRVLPDQRIPLGDTVSPLIEATNPNGAVVALVPGAAVYETVGAETALAVVDNGAFVRGDAPTRTARIRARVDGRLSETVAVRVFSATQVVATPSSARTGSEHRVDLAAQAVGANDPGLVWSVDGGDVNGTIEAVPGGGARYTAPKVVGSATRSVTIRVASAWDPNAETSVPITVESLVRVVVTPASVDLARTGQTRFTAEVDGLPESLAADSPLRGVTWRVIDDGSGQAIGTVQADGTFTAPDRGASIAVEAISRYDDTRAARGIARVLAGSGSGAGGGTSGEDGYLIDPTGGVRLTSYFVGDQNRPEIGRSIGFDFPFFGVDRSTVKISRYGFVTFTGVGDHINAPLSNQPDVICALADVLAPNTGGNPNGGFYIPEGFIAESRNESVFAVTYRCNVQINGYAGLYQDFQIVLVGKNQDYRGFQFQRGDIALVYKELLAPFNFYVQPVGATVGICGRLDGNSVVSVPEGFPSNGFVTEDARQCFKYFPEGKQFFLFRWNGTGYDSTLEHLP